MEKPLNLTKEELEELLDENPLLRAELEAIARNGVPLKDPREEDKKHPPFILNTASICGICGFVSEDLCLMSYVPRLQTHIRNRKALEEDLNLYKTSFQLSLNALTSCPHCLEELGKRTKEELIKQLTETYGEQKKREESYKNTFLENKLRREKI